VSNKIQNIRHRDGLPKHFTFVDEVRQPASLPLLFELAARAAPLFKKEFIHAPPHVVKEALTHESIEHKVAVLIQLRTITGGHQHECNTPAYHVGKVHFSNILVRATNWVGDAVMSIPALRAIRKRFPSAEIAVLAKAGVADLYSRESFADRVIVYDAKDLPGKLRIARSLRTHKFDCAILLQNAFEAALIAKVAGIPERIGYNRDGRGLLLTKAIAVPKRGEIPRHERYYYLELLRRAGIIDELPEVDVIRLERPNVAVTNCIGISPGAAYGTAKRWLPEHFVAAGIDLARKLDASIAIFGSKDERGLCDRIAERMWAAGIETHNYAGETTLSQFIDLASACRVFLTNDSGAMHIASAAGVPTVAVFGATDDIGTGPTGPLSRVVREPVECSPCLLRECPIDHRCMTRVTPDRVVRTALEVAS
jgi:heptosyltransferase II